MIFCRVNRYSNLTEPNTSQYTASRCHLPDHCSCDVSHFCFSLYGASRGTELQQLKKQLRLNIFIVCYTYIVWCFTSSPLHALRFQTSFGCDDNRIGSTKRDPGCRLSSRDSCERRVVFMLVRPQTRRRQKHTKTKAGLNSTGMDQNDRQYSIDPHHH